MKVFTRTIDAMQKIADQAAMYPAAWIIETKEAKMKAIVELSDKMYPYHTKYRSPLHAMKGSALLFNGDITIKFVLAEFAEFAAMVDLFYGNIGLAKSNPKVAEFYKQYGTNPRTQLEDIFKADLIEAIQQYNCTNTIAACMTAYSSQRKQFIEDHKCAI